MKNIIIKHYEKATFLLALITIFINLLDILEYINLETSNLFYLDNFILIYFIVEYIVRLYYSDNKKEFFKNNKLDLIAIIPFNSLFKVFRLFKIFRILKITKLLKISKMIRIFSFYSKVRYKIYKFLYTNNLIYSIYISIFLITIGALGIYLLEKGSTVNNFTDSLWWAFVTATTVGYGDLSPTTTLGRIVASILMLTGIGTIGLLTGTFATFFIKEDEINNSGELEKYIKNSKELTNREKIEIISYINYLKSKRKEKTT
ncbi:potassium channel family protein [Streptobacillus moniliformis]|uniref:potassium channel family protein n=1 Tax=Streptobacillus moniliformis TaxID=34105 RepID=UPI0007E349F1|nr:potassium channel family protein [Streptobacillus moniliformis]QXW65621.1 potassium channel family protein [Streptobacillus moniliformis]